MFSWGAGCFPEAAIIPCEDGRDYTHDIKDIGHIMLSENILLFNLLNIPYPEMFL